MKKTISYVLISCLFFAFNLTPAFASSNEDHTIENIVFQESSSVNERVINTLDENGIEYTIEENNIILKNPSPELVEEANGLVEKSFLNEVNSQENTINQISPFAATYPTNWVHNPLYDTYGSTTIEKAGKVTVAAAVSYYLINVTSIYNKFVRSVVAAVGTFFFVNGGTTDKVYYTSTHAWRELGPGSFSPTNGQFLGDYEIMRYEKITNAAGDIVDRNTRYAKSTVIEPIF
ncbi:hypothetical protein BFZC1_10347 [Lysinibacillus fusiformis ZC1]|uniref:hypothetical protein n=1 Tax=Lysinibacillus capsici TaxID=2115968 RepID=UPI0001DA5A1F|nr:hypothetical protein [Lysinibacillus capsici]EFI68461.1 hypothetical protein BFZC1_10347 [Lysinibacillus fusiformis ZC1]EKU42904.1 hypothetical protein C518_1851 [Lysinibacillus fusiformis ZB2]MBU5253700.1 hypothetical protein [Lysinibacillus capsici]